MLSKIVSQAHLLVSLIDTFELSLYQTNLTKS